MATKQQNLFNDITKLIRVSVHQLNQFLFSRDIDIQDKGRIYLRCAIYLVAGSIVYLTGILSFIGFEFGAIISVKALIESVGSVVFYSTFVGVSSIIISELIVFILWPIRFIIINFVGLIYRLLFNHDGENSISYIGTKVRGYFFWIVYGILSFLMLIVYIGPGSAGLILLVLLPALAYAVVVGWPRMLFSKGLALCLLFSIFNIGYQRALYSATREFQFLFINIKGEEKLINIVLPTADGLIVVGDGSNSVLDLDSMYSNTEKISLIITSISHAIGVKDTYFVARSDIKEIRKSENYVNEIARIGVTSELVLGLATPFLAVREGYDKVDADGNFDAIRGNKEDSISGVPGLISGVAYMMGILLGVLGILKISDHVENPGQTPLHPGAIRLAE